MTDEGEAALEPRQLPISHTYLDPTTRKTVTVLRPMFADGYEPLNQLQSEDEP